MTDSLCPICKRPLSQEGAETRFRPFCSKRCANVDLGRWLKGSYAIPAVATDESEAEKEEQTGEDSRPVRH